MANLTLRAVKGSPLTNAEMDGNFEYFTGSHAITGSLIVTGGITGSVQGIISSSYAVTASYIQNAQSASYVLNAQSASYVLNAVSASYATTSSYASVAQTLLGSIQSASYALTASNSSTASYVAGGNVDGTVALASNALSSNDVYTAKTNTNGDYKILFTDNISTDDQSNIYKETDLTLLYNPGLNKLTVGALSASAGITGSLLGAASAVGTLVQNVVITGSLTQWSGSTSLGYSDGNGNYNFTSYKTGDNETIVIGANNGSFAKPNFLQMIGSNGQVLLRSLNELTLYSSNSNISLLANNTIVSGSILISGSIVPNVPAGSTTSSFNLGSPTAAWKDIYVSNGTINFLNNAGTIVQTMGAGNNQLVGTTSVSGSILISGSIIPNVSGSTTSSFNLGSPTAAWKDIYVSNGTINFLNSNGTVAQTMGTGNNQLVGATSISGDTSITGSLYVKNGFSIVLGISNNTNGSPSTLLQGKNNQTGTWASFSHVEGWYNAVDGYASHAEGEGNTIWSGATGSHAEGYYTQVYGNPYSPAEDGSWSHTEGYYTVSSGSYSHAEGYYTTTIGSASHAEGIGNYTYGPYSHAEGNGNTTIGEGSHAEGQLNSTLGIYSHVEGLETQTTGAFSHAEGYGSIAVGDYTHAEGGGGNDIGVGGYAVGKASHAEGVLTVTIGTGSHAEGYRTHAKGWYSHAEGFYTSASGNYSHAEGSNTIASGSYQHVQGQFNTHGDSTSLMIVGNGTSDGARRDAFKVRMSGSIILPTTQSSIPAWSGSNGEMVFATVSGANLFYVWMGNQWRSGSLA